MYRLLSCSTQPRIRCFCESLQLGYEPLAKRSFVKMSAGFVRGKLLRGGPRELVTVAPRTASWVQQSSQRRHSRNSGNAESYSTIHKTREEAAAERDGTNRKKNLSQQPASLSHQALLENVERVTRLFFAQQGIPSEEVTVNALRAFAGAEARLIADTDGALGADGRQSASDSTASHLLGLNDVLDGDPTSSATKSKQTRQNVMTKISEAAYAIITHPPVTITPLVLKEYIKLQGRLCRPETLPYILSLYASKPKPQMKAGKIEYIKQNPDRADHAVEASAAEAALDVALEAKNLVAAIAIIEKTYATKAFVRAKLIRTTVLPGLAALLAPAVAWSVATQISQLQTSMDTSLMRTLAFMGFLTYFGVVGSLGIVVVTTSNDQMKRVTWSPGQPLLQRWVREDERAALDKVACAFGFSEEHRWGEEDGPEWLALKEYMLQRDLLLDAVELMKGME